MTTEREDPAPSGLSGEADAFAFLQWGDKKGNQNVRELTISDFEHGAQAAIAELERYREAHASEFGDFPLSHQIMVHMKAWASR